MERTRAPSEIENPGIQLPGSIGPTVDLPPIPLKVEKASTLWGGIRLLLRDPRNGVKRIARFLRPMRKDYRRRFQMTLRDWLLYHQRQVGFTECRWMGVRAWKNPLDAWIYQEILFEVKPDVVVEIGSGEGGSTLFLAHLLDLLGKGQVLSIDIDRSFFHLTHPRITILTGDSSSPEMVAKVHELCRGKIVLVVQDGNHTKEGVLKDLRSYSDLVSLHSYFIVEDGIIDLYVPRDGIGSFDEGPLVGVTEFLKENPQFEVDRKKERYLMTYNPMGYLRRVC